MKTKDELLKLLEKNYYSVQRKEYQVYDKNEKLRAEFLKKNKQGDTALKQELKDCDLDDKQAKTDFKQENLEAKKAYDVKKTDLDVTKKEVKAKVTEALKASKEDKLVKTQEIKTQIEKAKQNYENEVAELVTDYNGEVDALNKRVAVLKEKKVKDEKSYQQLLKDLNKNKDENEGLISEKETSKLSSFDETTKQEIEKLDDEIKKVTTKINKEIALSKELYEEELEEIIEQIESDDIDYNEKVESIKNSSDQRIKVREKHYQRALDDKDSRSAKAHQKDIQKIKKERDRDLQLLEKTYTTQNEKNQTYKNKFMTEHIEKWSNMESDLLKEVARLNLEKALYIASSDSRSTLSKYDFELEHIKVLEQYNKDYRELLEKKYSFELENDINLLNEELERQLLELRFNHDKDVFKRKLDFVLFELNHGLKQLDTLKEQVDTENKHEQNLVMATYDLDLELAKLIMNYQVSMNSHVEQVKKHKAEHKRHESYKKDLASFESGFEVLLKQRQTEMVEYQKMEIMNSYDQKQKFLQTQLSELEKDLASALRKLEAHHLQDKKHYEKRINELVGPMLDELKLFEEEETVKIEEKEAYMRGLQGRKGRKERKKLEPELLELKQKFEYEKQQKQSEIDLKVSNYKSSLQHSEERLLSAKEQFSILYENESKALEDELDFLLQSRTDALEKLDSRLEQTLLNYQTYQEKRTARFDLHTAQNQEYLDSELFKHTSMQDRDKQNFDSESSELNGLIAQKVDEVTREYNELEERIEADLREQESTLQIEKDHANKELDLIDVETENKVEQTRSQVNTEIDTLNAKYESSMTEIDGELKEQLDQHNDHRKLVNKNIQTESTKLETLEKELKRKSDDKLNDELSKIQVKMKEELQKIK